MSKSNWLFQSTPANFTAGDPSPLPAFFIATLFQSTPANFTAGDDAVPHDGQRLHAVSIHAHQFHGGRRPPRPGWPARQPVSIHAHQFHGGRRLRPAPAHRCRASFNPRPPISWRATPWTQARRRRTAGFNPRPPISWRATAVLGAVGAAAELVSIHAHQFHGGRHRLDAEQRGVFRVSIHAHQFHGGRPAIPSTRSASPTVSIHAHQFHGGRR